MKANSGGLVDIGDTRLYVADRGRGYPVVVLHGGPGMDHHMFGDYLDPLTDTYRLIFVDQRAQGRSDRAPEETWTLEQTAKDVSLLAEAMNLESYAVLGHSYGAFVALQHAADFPRGAALAIISSGVPGNRFLMSFVERQIEIFEPESLREQIEDSWAQEQQVQTAEEVATLLARQLPFHFADPLDPRISDYIRRTSGAVYSPEVLRKFSSSEYGGIEVEHRLAGIRHPVLILAGRHDRTCSVEAAEFMAANIANADLVILENSGHMSFAEETGLYLSSVRRFLSLHAGP